MLSFVVPPIIQQKLTELNASPTAAFNIKELIDILLPEDIAYYIYINRVLQSIVKTPRPTTTVNTKVLAALYSIDIPLEIHFKQSCSDNEHYMKVLDRVLGLVKNIPFILGINPDEHIDIDSISNVDNLPRWFKDQLIETTVGCVDNMSCTDTTQYNLFVLRPVDEHFANIVLIGADKSKTDNGEVVLAAVDKSIDAALQYTQFSAIVKTSLFRLFTQLSITYRLI